MPSDTKNVKLGVCKVYYNGVDLGYTKGGVEVAVTTETHKSEVDQFGKTAIGERILGRAVTAKTPLAETTLRNLARVMPGATLVETGGAKASGTVTLPVANAANGETIKVNGKTVTFKAANPVSASLEVLVGADVDASGANLAAMLNASVVPEIAQATYAYSAGTNTLTVTARDSGVAGDAFKLEAGTYAGVVFSGGTLAGGADPTISRVDVTDGVGTNLLANAKRLTLHPQNLADSDYSEDFVIPLAATGGALTFAYKVDEERIYPVEFSGYPDPATRKLFWIGDETAA